MSLAALLAIVIESVLVAIDVLFRSSLMALNGVYRFLYFFLIKKIPIKEVPSGLEEHVFDVEGVELGKYALQLPPPSDNKVVPLLDLAIQSVVQQPCNTRLQSSTQFKLRT